MDNSKFLVIDSGRGGLNVLKSLYNLPNFGDFYYLSDGRYAPYGDKSEGFLIARAKALINTYGSYFDGVILACNTLSTVALDKIKGEYPFPVFGIRPVAPEGRSLLLCTKATANSAFVKNLCKDPALTVCAPKGLVSAIENNIYNILKGDYTSVTEFLPEDDCYDSVLLGCTHFIFLKKLIEKLYRHSRVFDGTASLVNEFSDHYKKSRGILPTDVPVRIINEKCFLGEEGRQNFAIFCKMMA